MSLKVGNRLFKVTHPLLLWWGYYSSSGQVSDFNSLGGVWWQGNTKSEFWWWRWHLSNVDFNISVSKCGFLFNYNDPNHLLLIYLLKRQVFFFSSLSLFLIICSNCVVVSLALPQALYRKDLVLAFVEHWHWVFFSFGLRCSPSRQSSIKGGPGKSFNVLVQKSN